MRADDLRKLLKAQPFAPVRLALSDGRAVCVRHPDQVVVTERNAFIGLTKVQRSTPLATPHEPDAIARDWMFINLIHIAAIEPENDIDVKRRPEGK